MHAVAASHAHYANKGSSSSSHKKKSRRSSPFKATSGTVRKTSSFVQSGGIWSAIEQTEFTVLDWLMESHDPTADDERAGFWFKLIHSRIFNVCLVILILASCAMIGINIDYGDYPETEIAFDVLEHFFTWVFVLEAIVKIVALTPSVYFSSGWDVFDFVVASISAIGIVINMASGAEEGAIPRVLRVFRLLRIGRVARTFQFFSELNNLLLGLLASLSGLFWAFVLLLVLIYVYALIFTEAVGKAEVWIGRPEEEDVRAFYGTVPRSMYSLFQIMSLESWSMALARPIWEVQGWTVSLFVSYVLLSAFGILNLVIGLFSDKLMESSRSTRQKREQESIESRKRHRTQIIQSFQGMDTDGSNGISSDELRRAVHIYVYQQYDGDENEHAADAAAFAKAAESNMFTRDKLDKEHCEVVDPLMKVGMPEDDGLGLEDIIEGNIDSDSSDSDSSFKDHRMHQQVLAQPPPTRHFQSRRQQNSKYEEPLDAGRLSPIGEEPAAAGTRYVAPPAIPDDGGGVPASSRSQAHLALSTGYEEVQTSTLASVSAATGVQPEVELAVVPTAGTSGLQSYQLGGAEGRGEFPSQTYGYGRLRGMGKPRSSSGASASGPSSTEEDKSAVKKSLRRHRSSIVGDEVSEEELERRYDNMGELFRLLHVSEDVLLDISYLIENSDRRVLGSVLSQMDRKLFNVVDDMEEEQVLARYEGFAAQVQDVERAIRLVNYVPGSSSVEAHPNSSSVATASLPRSDGDAGHGSSHHVAPGPPPRAGRAAGAQSRVPFTPKGSYLRRQGEHGGSSTSAGGTTGTAFSFPSMPGGATHGRSGSRGASRREERRLAAAPIPVIPAAAIPEALQHQLRRTGDDTYTSSLLVEAAAAARDTNIHHIGHGRRASVAAHKLNQPGLIRSNSTGSSGPVASSSNALDPVVKAAEGDEDKQSYGVGEEGGKEGEQQVDTKERRRRIKALRMDYMPRVLLQHPLHANDMQALSVKVLQSMMAARNYRTDRDLPYEFVTGLLMEIGRSVELKDVLMLSAQLGKQSYEMQQLVRVVRAEQAAMFARAAHAARVEAERGTERARRGRSKLEQRMDRMENRLGSMEGKLDYLLALLQSGAAAAPDDKPESDEPATAPSSGDSSEST